MNLPVKWRKIVYIVAVVALLASAVAAGLIVFTDLLTEDQVTEWARLVVSVFGMLAGILALVNLTPDSTPPE